MGELTTQEKLQLEIQRLRTRHDDLGATINLQNETISTLQHQIGEARKSAKWLFDHWQEDVDEHLQESEDFRETTAEAQMRWPWLEEGH